VLTEVAPVVGGCGIGGEGAQERLRFQIACMQSLGFSAVVTRLPVGSSGRWRGWRCLQFFCKTDRRGLRLERGWRKHMSREGAEEGRRSTATFPSSVKIYSMTLSSPATGSPRLRVGQLREVEEKWRGGKWQEGEGSRGSFGL
jgi:hypothetical protein